MWCGSGSRWTERYDLPVSLPQSFPEAGQEQTLGEGSSSSFGGLPLRPHSDHEVASSCLNGVPLKGPVLTSGLGVGMGWLGVSPSEAQC